ncbi:MAG: methyltransferase family protein [Bacteroidales bacterium]
MNKLKMFGVGPKIGKTAFPFALFGIIAPLFWPQWFNFVEVLHPFLYPAGLALFITGIISYGVSVKFLLKGLKNTTLVTTGPFYLCRNPLYTSIILLLIPGVSLIINSWPMLMVSIVAYIRFRMLIAAEYTEMATFFGKEWERYRSNTPEFFPFPVKKWFKK